MGAFNPALVRGAGAARVQVVSWGLQVVPYVEPETRFTASAIDVGRGHSLALKSDGSVVRWGRNSAGQSAVPGNLSDVIAIAAGEMHSLPEWRTATAGRFICGSGWRWSECPGVVQLCSSLPGRFRRGRSFVLQNLRFSMALGLDAARLLADDLMTGAALECFVGIEVKKTASPTSGDFKGLRHLSEQTGKKWNAASSEQVARGLEEEQLAVQSLTLRAR